MLINMKKSKKNNQSSRRDFLKNTSLAAAGFFIVPRHVLGRGYVAPSDKLNIAGIGAGIFCIFANHPERFRLHFPLYSVFFCLPLVVTRVVSAQYQIRHFFLLFPYLLRWFPLHVPYLYRYGTYTRYVRNIYGIYTGH